MITSMVIFSGNKMILKLCPFLPLPYSGSGHDDVMKWKHFPCYWSFVRGIHRSPVNSPHKGQICGALMFLWSAPWIHDWVNNREAGDLRRHHTHYDIIVLERWVDSMRPRDTYMHWWNGSPLVQIMVWHQTVDKQFPGQRTICCRMNLYRQT